MAWSIRNINISGINRWLRRAARSQSACWQTAAACFRMPLSRSCHSPGHNIIAQCFSYSWWDFSLPYSLVPTWNAAEQVQTFCFFLKQHALHSFWFRMISWKLQFYLIHILQGSVQQSHVLLSAVSLIHFNPSLLVLQIKMLADGIVEMMPLATWVQLGLLLDVKCPHNALFPYKTNKQVLQTESLNFLV